MRDLYLLSYRWAIYKDIEIAAAALYFNQTIDYDDENDADGK